MADAPREGIQGAVMAQLAIETFDETRPLVAAMLRTRPWGRRIIQTDVAPPTYSDAARVLR
jgi:hypothetical protein